MAALRQAVTRDELLARFVALRQAQVRGRRAPHRPLLLLWPLGRFEAHGSTAVRHDEAEEPVSRLINDFGPPVRSPGAARQRAAMPFVHLERDSWDLQDVPDSGERLLAERGTLVAASRILLDQHSFHQAPHSGFGGPAVRGGGARPHRRQLTGRTPRRRQRRPDFAEEVLRAYAYACAVCGFDGRLGRNPVGLEAAHIRRHSQEGPDELPNALAPCALHHALLDLGVLGPTADGQRRRAWRGRAAGDRASGGGAHRLARRPGVQGRRLTPPDAA